MMQFLPGDLVKFNINYAHQGMVFNVPRKDGGGFRRTIVDAGLVFIVMAQMSPYDKTTAMYAGVSQAELGPAGPSGLGSLWYWCMCHEGIYALDGDTIRLC